MVDNLDQPDPFDTKNNIIFKCCNFFLSVVSHDMAASAHESNLFFFFFIDVIKAFALKFPSLFL